MRKVPFEVEQVRHARHELERANFAGLREALDAKLPDGPGARLRRRFARLGRRAEQARARLGKLEPRLVAFFGQRGDAHRTVERMASKVIGLESHARYVVTAAQAASRSADHERPRQNVQRCIDNAQLDLRTLTRATAAIERLVRRRAATRS
jgi:hypothetical protein